MTVFYGGDPRGNDRDAVRFLIGDTDSTDALLTNDEIAFLLEQSPDIYIAAANGCDQIAAQFMRAISRRSIDENPETVNKFRSFQELAKQYRQQAARRTAMPFAGGISKATKKAERQNTDRVEPAFRVDLQEIRQGDTPDRH